MFTVQCWKCGHVQDISNYTATCKRCGTPIGLGRPWLSRKATLGYCSVLLLIVAFLPGMPQGWTIMWAVLAILLGIMAILRKN